MDVTMINKNNIKETRVTRGEIYYAQLENAVGSEQGGIRPVVVVQNDVGNHFSPTIIVAAMTSQDKTNIPTHVELDTSGTGLEKYSTILLEQIRTIDKSRLKQKAGKLKPEFIEQLDHAIKVSFGLVSNRI